MTEKSRLDYLDGLRGMAALYVVAHHAFLKATETVSLPPFLQHLLGWLSYGHFAVDVFITLSGYCLMMPAARPSYCVDTAGALRFYGRRCRRILPPYYGAVFLSLLLIVLVPAMGVPLGFPWDGAGAALASAPFLSHLFLAHNLHPAWINTIDAPLWSVATEFQIYLFFPLLFLPVWRRWGTVPVVVLGYGIGLALGLGIPAVFQACPWFLGLFALGMAAAAVHFPDRPRPSRKRYGIAAAVLFCTLGIATKALGAWGLRHIYLLDLAVGLTTAAFLVYATQDLLDAPHRPSLPVRFLNWRPVLFVGSFSYSLYLIHFPVLAWLSLVTTPWHLSAATQLAVMLVAGTALAVAAAFLFYLLIERWFLPSAPKGPFRIPADAAEPAP